VSRPAALPLCTGPKFFFFFFFFAVLRSPFFIVALARLVYYEL
jgi:hypothetical protein